MSAHLQRELTYLRNKVGELADASLTNVRKAVASALNGDVATAREVVEADDTIDRIEVEVEEECLKALALYQPVAVDLRFIVAMLKIGHNLERISDLSVRIAEGTVALHEAQGPGFPFDLSDMGERVAEMVRAALEALMEMDAGAARRVWLQDDEVDRLREQMDGLLREEIKKAPEHLDRWLVMLSTVRHLERVGDHAASVAKDVIYLVDAEIVRHQGGVFKQQAR